MIKQTETHEKPIFGVDFAAKKKRVQKSPVVSPIPDQAHRCQFQENEIIDGHVKSCQCKNKKLENGWCEEHQHAQEIMDLGKRLGYRPVEIKSACLIIGQGELNWEAYAERASGKGLNTVLDYLRQRC